MANHPKKTNKLVIFTAPSGAGKTTLVRHLVNQLDNLAFSVSATTRKKRAHETDGHDYYFISVSEFKNRIEAGEFLEWEEVYDGNYYGTLKSEIDRIAELGKHVIFDIDVKGAKNIKEHYGSRALAVFVKVPSLEALKKRLLARKTETPESIRTRVARAAMEMKYECYFDTTVINDDIETAQKTAKEVVTSFLNQIEIELLTNNE